MSLSSDLISQFAKATKDETKKKESTVYGVTLELNGKMYVKMDGSDLVTPVITTTELKSGERVSVMIKDHHAIVTGNVTAPAASTDTTDGIKDEITHINLDFAEIKVLVSDKVSTKELEAELAIINEAIIGKASIADLEAVKAQIKDLDVESLNAKLAEIDKAIIGKASIDDLNAAVADIGILDADLATIKTLVGGNLTMDNIQSLVLTASKVTVDNAFIKDAMIDRVSAGKLTAGVVNTNLVKLESEDGAMTINGALQQFKDNAGNVRIQLGKDATGDFTFALYGADGTGQLINQNGITASAISDGLIVDKMVGDNANISGAKLDIDSVITEVNGSSTSIKSSKIFFDDKNQSLDIVFNNLNTSVTEIESTTGKLQETVTSMNTDLTIAQGEIKGLISNTTIITEGGETIQLKDDYANFKVTVDEISTKLGSLETNYAKTLKSTKTQYYLSLSALTLVGGSWSEAMPEWTTGKFIWQRLVYIYSDDSQVIGTEVCIQGAQGPAGESGYTWIKYSDTPTTGMSDSPTGKIYMGIAYNKETPTPSTNYSDYKWSLIKGSDGAAGANGVGIKSIVEYYQVSTSNTTQPTTWSTTPPAMTAVNKYLWNYEAVTYTDNTVKNTEKRVIGVYGDQGQNGATGATGNGINTITNYYLATNLATGVTTSTTGWTTTIQTVSLDKRYLWNYETILYTNGTSKSTVPCIIGVYGDKGEPGANGANGQSVTSITPQFAKHTSATTVPPDTITWYDTCPAYEKGKYLWLRSKVIYANPSATRYTTPYYDASWDAKGTAEDAQTTVTSKISEFQQTLDGFQTTVSETYTTKQESSDLEKALNGNIDTAVSGVKNDILTNVDSKYTNKDDFTLLSETVSSNFKQTSEDITASFDKAQTYTKEVDGKLQEFQNTVGTHIRFSADGIDLGKTNSPFTATLNNEQLAFKQDGVTVAYVGNNKLYITEAEVIDSLRIGKAPSGFFTWVHKPDGNMSLKWSDK